jgi:hypothetical protein
MGGPIPTHGDFYGVPVKDRNVPHPGVCRVQKTGHFFCGFPLDSHGQTKGPHLQIADLTIEHLAHQVSRLSAVQRPRAVFAATDFFEVVGDAHGDAVKKAADCPRSCHLDAILIRQAFIFLTY